MRLQNLTDGDLRTWRHGRAWFGPLHCEWSLFRPSSLLLVGAFSWGVKIYLRGLGSLWFGRYDDDCFNPRGFELSVRDGAVHLEHPWTSTEWWRFGAPWWRKSIRIPVADWFLGRLRHELDKGEPVEVFVPMPEGCYRAVATPEVSRIWRRFAPLRVRRSVSLNIHGGIPFSGKGENSWDCGDDGLFGIGGDTVEDAVGNAVALVLRRRGQHGLDSKRTGAEPVRIINNRESNQ